MIRSVTTKFIMNTLDFAAVQAAAKRIAGHVRRTPVQTSQTLDRLAGREVYCKCENFQTTGSFKYRGATNAVGSLDPALAARGVVTHSSGNHGQALARAAQALGVPCVVVMPAAASRIKKDAILGYGASVVESGPSLTDREEVVKQVLAERGGAFVPPFDHPDVIAGQGTAMLELLEEVPDLDAVVAPIGGGGLISGFCIAAKGFNPKIRIFGAEPTGANAAALSKQAGERVQISTPTSIADGLLANRIGELTWPVIRDSVEQIFQVSEEQIAAAMRLIWERMKLVIEPSAGVGIAVILSEEFRALPGIKKVGVVLCGGNVALDKLPWKQN